MKARILIGTAIVKISTYNQNLKIKQDIVQSHPFLIKISKTKQDQVEKSTDGEDNKGWNAGSKLNDKRNSTKVTNNTNSENDENSWIKSNQSKGGKSKGNVPKQENHTAKGKQLNSSNKKNEITNTKCK